MLRLDPVQSPQRSWAYGNMGLIPLILAFLAPALTRAVAFLQPIPEPTQTMPTMDGWSPSLTASPQLLFGLSRREQGGSNMPNPNRNMCNKHLLRRARLLRPSLKYCMHRFNCHVRILHRRCLFDQRGNSKMYQCPSAGMLRMALHLR